MKNYQLIFVDSILETFWFWVILLAIILIGIILFFLTGFIHIHRGYIGIIEEMGVYKGVYQPGYYYFHPLYGRRVGMYKSGLHINDIVFRDQLFRVTYVIDDVKAYHYAGHNLMLFVDDLLMKNKKNKIDELAESLKKYGIKIENIETHQ
jgi:regulator of protease activity HflC (stomatin/prohibitin superfamily)